MAAPPPPPRGGMSLYANLLDPKAASSASISSAPVLYSQPGDNGDAKDDAAARKAADPALRFQPIRRPQVKQKTTKPSFPKAIPPGVTAAPNAGATTGAAPAPAQQPRSTLADWAATEDDEYMWAGGDKRQRGGRRRKKKKMDEQPMETDWDELYDPARPTNVEEYLRSDERIREVQEWKAVLYAHRRRRKSSYDSDEDEEEVERRPAMSNQFAPPAEYSFAPPPPSPPRHDSPPAPPPLDESADDAYARRLAMSSMAAAPPPPTSPTPPPPPPPDGATISRGPVRYEAPPQPPDDDNGMDIDSETNSTPPSFAPDAADSSSMPDSEPTPRTNRPGQAGFAQRLMSKYGWTAGSGLGADSSGIVNPLRVQVEKRRKRPDAEGGGYIDPGGRGKIIGGKRGAGTAGGAGGGRGGGDEGGGSKFGPMSDVIVLQNMLEGMDDLQGEIEQGLGQEIGEECGEKYGRVERLYIDVQGRQVFIKFTDQVSALRAVNALEGRIFNGNSVAARFYNSEKFEEGVYA